MGPENGFDPNNYTLYLGDTPIARGEIELVEITAPVDAQKPERILQLQQVEFTVHIKTPNRWRCRGRKRFIKLLMSMGISRNQAESVAGVSRIAGVPYVELWQSYFFWGEGL